jgi:hypothetical protein
MSTLLTPAPSSKPLPATTVERIRTWLSQLNLHFAGVGLLLLLNVYLLVHMAFLWQTASSNDAQAAAQQQVALKTAEIAAQPLRGLDTKLERATAESDKFYQQRLPARVSDVLAELGSLTHKQGVRLIRSQDTYVPALAGSPGELTEMRIDAGLSGDYRPLVQLINALERDKLFFLIDSVTLTGQQSGTVNLRLRLRTYLRGHAPEADTLQSETGEAAPDTTAPDTAATPAGGPAR